MPLADDHGDNKKAHLADQIVLEKPPDQDAAAMHLQVTPRLGFSSPTAAAVSSERSGLSADCGSVSVVDATSLCRLFNAAAMALMSACTPQVELVRSPCGTRR